MSNENKDSENKELVGHSYDGITELDNPLPGWWLWTFFLTIIFAFLYYIHYQSGSGPTLVQELEVAIQVLSKNEKREPKLLESEEALAAQMQGEAILNLGATAYNEKCVACHGQELQGQIGPNLVDKFWIHGKGTRMDIVKVIREGVLDKGMPAWELLLKKDEVYAVTAFILSKKGNQVSNPKAPQGEPVE